VAGFRIGRGRAQQPRPTQYGQERYAQRNYPHQSPPYNAPSGYDDAPGHTVSFAVGEAPDAYAYDAHAAGDQQGYAYKDEQGHVATYRAGQSSAPSAGPRLHWKELLRGIVLHPGRTFWQMRDYQVWGPALLVTFGYGMLAVFGFDSARKGILDSNFSAGIPWMVTTAVAVVLSGLMTGAVTHALARQFGGDGSWAPTIGLAMLITSITDAPRLLFAIFLGGANGFVQFLGWVTWLACAALLTSMVSTSHDLPWQKALGAASVQLVLLLVVFKLPTL
jgi:hypothetical protein